MSNVINVVTYSPSPTDAYFFDNNIWMLLHCPIANAREKEQRIFSSFLSQAITRKCTIFINAIVLSEFANAYLKLDFHQWQDAGGSDWTSYRLEKRFVETIAEIKNAISKILKMCQRGNDDFNAIDIDKVLGGYGQIDFNDSYYLELCSRKKWKLVTQDRAIVNSSTTVAILTALQ